MNTDDSSGPIESFRGSNFYEVPNRFRLGWGTQGSGRNWSHHRYLGARFLQLAVANLGPGNPAAAKKIWSLRALSRLPSVLEDQNAYKYAYECYASKGRAILSERWAANNSIGVSLLF